MTPLRRSRTAASLLRASHVGMVLARPAERWGVSEEEAGAASPADAVSAPGHRRLLRAVDVDAPADLLFRWVCQLRVAPYSYDLVDNLGRRSPRRLTPGLDELAEGQSFLVLTITGFEAGRSITGTGTKSARRLFGVLAGCYQVVPQGAARSRLVVRLDVEEPASLLGRARYLGLAWGDLVMMRKQLLTLKALAEAQHREETATR